ncbi:MAG: hypothetical protein ACR2P1_16775 [Pseudomonadales bacterium]
MLSGAQTLGTLDRGLQGVRKEIDRVDADLSRIGTALTTNMHNQNRTANRLANIRLDEITRGTLTKSLDTADQQAKELFAQREQALNALERTILDAKEDLRNIEGARSAQLKEVNYHAQEVIDAEREAQTALEIDDDYQAQLAAVREVDSIADEAEDKTVQAQQDRTEKGKPYEADPLFMYLWQRGFGTSEYSANPLARTLDGWVARRCGYEKARVNYWTLLEIPKRLESHAKSARDQAALQLKALEELELVAAQEVGIPAKQESLAQAQEKLENIDAAIEAAEDQLDAHLEQRGRYASGKDRYIEQSLALLNDAMQRRDIYELTSAVQATQSREDDALVREIGDLREQAEDLEEDITEQRAVREAKIDRLNEFEQVRRQFKQRRFDDVRSGFSNGDVITSVLGQFLGGLIGSSDLWRTLERHQRHIDVGAWPDFGSGGLGHRMPRRHSPWHRPGVNIRIGGSGGFRLPRSGGFSSRGRGGGGFRTGGGF